MNNHSRLIPEKWKGLRFVQPFSIRVQPSDRLALSILWTIGGILTTKIGNQNPNYHSLALKPPADAKSPMQRSR